MKTLNPVIIGIGIDIEEISRFKNMESRFYNKVFTENELKYCFSKENPYPSLTARFCGKEAVIKALGSRNNPPLKYNEIETFHNEYGVPYIRINNSKYQNLQMHCSLSHCNDKAIAFVIIYEVENNGKD